MRKQKKERLGIQSVEVAARILAAMSGAAQPLALKDLARLAKMPPGKVHRYLVSLARTDLVMQEGESGHYGIGPASIALGLAGLRSLDAVRSAAELLPTLRDETDETALLAVWSATGPVVIRLEESGRPVFMNIRVGSVLPLLRTATGRIFAAYLATSEVKRLLEREQKEGRAGSKAKIDAAGIDHLLREARQQGIAAITGDLVPGVTALSAPVFDHQGRIVAAIGLLGRSEDLSADLAGRAAHSLKAIAAQISYRLGFSAPS